MHKFNDVTLLITHYNRSSSLERLLNNFRDLQVEFSGIVVSDDGSKPEHLDKLRSLSEVYRFQLVTTPQNKGLGNNINKGQDQVKTEFTLYIQEDFVPKPLFADKFPIALDALKADKNLDVVRFYAYFTYPYLRPFKAGFSEMIFSVLPWFHRYRKFYYYSDHPHLRRSSFFKKFGRYKEDIPVERTEYQMMMSFLKHKGKALFYENYNDLFSQENSSHEPSTVTRNYWRESKNPLIFIARHLYRQVRFNLDLLTFKKHDT
ncbi:MAG TPA: glycosyltransferase [Pedobacter sp.]|nr:glycosyltransferase [Pedobacter sp.]